MKHSAKTSRSAPIMTLVLDAMGVIYSVGDDVAELLRPFIHERGGESNRFRIESLYRDASLGRLSAAEFWQAVHLDPAVEDEYLERLQLSSGVLEFLSAPLPEVSGIWCLSNDVSEWSRKLRDRFALTQFIQGFVISGDVGVRKPDAAIYCKLLAEVGVEPGRIIFVDDRQANLDAARLLGMDTVLFAPAGSEHAASHRIATGFRDLCDLIPPMAFA
jgi:HAD superfamily hydrolase (TIGR01509 family)